MGNGNRPAPEFRREAVRLALTSGRTRQDTTRQDAARHDTTRQDTGGDR